MKVLLIIPAYNEEDNIVRVIEELRAGYPQYDYIVVNDGSSDDTAQLCRQHGYRMLDLPINLGLAGAFQAGMRYAWTYGYDCAIQFDADGQHQPQYLDAIVAQVKAGTDIVIGSRFVTRPKPYTFRMLGSRIITASIWVTTGHRICDPTSGQRAYSRLVMKHLAGQINFGPEPDTVAYLLNCGASVQEVQVEMRERVAGTSYLSVFRSAGYMLRMCVSIWLIQWTRQRSALGQGKPRKGRKKCEGAADSTCTDAVSKAATTTKEG